VEQRNDPVLGNALRLRDGGHTAAAFVLCGQQIKDLGQQIKDLGQQIKDLGQQIKDLGQQIKDLGQ